MFILVAFLDESCMYMCVVPYEEGSGGEIVIIVTFLG